MYQNSTNTNVTGLVNASAGGTFTGVTLTQNAILVGGASNAIVSTALTNGQLIIGSTGAPPVAASLTAGANITITPGAGSLTIAASLSTFPYTVVTGTTQLMLVNNGYIANNAGVVTFTLPVTAAVGDSVVVSGINNATGWKIAQSASQSIRYGTSTTTVGVGGSLQSIATTDTVELVCVVANLTFLVVSGTGNVTVV